MPISVTCPSCAAKMTAPAGAAGKRANCVLCRAVLLVPLRGALGVSSAPTRRAPPRYDILAVLLALLLGTAVPLLWPMGLGPFSAESARPVGLTRESYRSIEVGMTAAEVRLHLGEPDEIAAGGAVHHWTYARDDKTATILLEAGGVVVGKSQSGLE
jgi:hypothetical protein